MRDRTKIIDTLIKRAQVKPHAQAKQHHSMQRRAVLDSTSLLRTYYTLVAQQQYRRAHSQPQLSPRRQAALLCTTYILGLGFLFLVLFI